MDLTKEKSCGVSTRSKTAELSQQGGMKNNKRKADDTVPNNEREKRAALGNLTNFNRTKPKNVKENVDQNTTKKNQISIEKQEKYEHFMQPKELLPTTKIITRGAIAKTKPTQVKEKKLYGAATKNKSKEIVLSTTSRRLSNDFEKTENSLYVSAVEELTADLTIFDVDNDTKSSPLQLIAELPEGVEDFDKENIEDPNQVSEYAMDIFLYMKDREKLFQIKNYMVNQAQLSKWMRALLVDWMVEVQESFELNHETLYLAAKLVDLYLSEIAVDRDTLQLLGATSLMIASKYDERTPPLVEDFLYICDGAYSRKDLLKMEITVLKTVGYDLGIPISYRFLRRYARCAKVSMAILTLARFILEYSLMDYQTVSLSDSKMASAALFIALKMNKLQGWNKTLEYYSGYAVSDFQNILSIINDSLHKKPKEGLNTIRTKYSYAVFHEVAKIPLISNEELLSDSVTN